MNNQESENVTRTVVTEGLSANSFYYSKKSLIAACDKFKSINRNKMACLCHNDFVPKIPMATGQNNAAGSIKIISSEFVPVGTVFLFDPFQFDWIPHIEVSEEKEDMFSFVDFSMVSLLPKIPLGLYGIYNIDPTLPLNPFYDYPAVINLFSKWRSDIRCAFGKAWREYLTLLKETNE